MEMASWEEQGMGIHHLVRIQYKYYMVRGMYYRIRNIRLGDVAQGAALP